MHNLNIICVVFISRKDQILLTSWSHSLVIIFIHLIQIYYIGHTAPWITLVLISERPKVVSAEISADISAEISAETEISAMPAETESEKGHIFFKFSQKNLTKK